METVEQRGILMSKKSIQAATELRDHLQGVPWLIAVGLGEEEGSPCIFLYVKKFRRDALGFLAGGWRGFPVVVRKMGTPRSLATFQPKTTARRQPPSASQIA